jgi:hypothetical protein
MGRTIPSFRIAAVLEEKTWKPFRNNLSKNENRKVFDNLFSVATLYNSASSYAAIPIRIHPIMMSIVFHHYKILKEHLESKKNMLLFTDEKDNNNDININQNNSSSIILQKELDKWKTYSDILRQPNRDLFNEMIQSAVYKYSSAIDAKGENYATESLLMSLIFEQHKLMKNISR